MPIFYIISHFLTHSKTFGKINIRPFRTDVCLLQIVGVLYRAFVLVFRLSRPAAEWIGVAWPLLENTPDGILSFLLFHPSASFRDSFCMKRISYT